MTNTYGYNRKTQEEDMRILDAVRRHHNEVVAKGYLVVMTSLVGSQNYDLDDEQSDIDTFSFIFPPLNDIALAREPFATCYTSSDGGHCEIKDIRLALNLLRKTSPNSVEYFVSKYKIYNPVFESILRDYLDDNNKIWHMVHCNYNHMLYAITGMAYQLIKRNMPAGKRFSHALRLDDMYYHFINSVNAGAVLELRTGGDRELALIAKRDTENEKEYNEQCEHTAIRFEELKDNFILSEEQKQIQQTGLAMIDSFQWKLFKKYLEETNK